MHPWEDFAETFAHYLHITGTLQTAAAIGIHLDADRDEPARHRRRPARVVPGRADPAAAHATGSGCRRAFNRINRAMGFGDLYPFDIVGPVRHKLAFMHDIVTRAPLTTDEQYALAFVEETERA